MPPEELVRFLKHIKVWLPTNSHIRDEIDEVIRRIVGQPQ
jgi:hypothetical protein